MNFHTPHQNLISDNQGRDTEFPNIKLSNSRIVKRIAFGLRNIDAKNLELLSIFFIKRRDNFFNQHLAVTASAPIKQHGAYNWARCGGLSLG